jgi:hypothetical protein
MSDDDRAAIVAMSGLPGLGHRRLRRLIDLGRPARTWAELERRGPRGAGIEMDASLDLRWTAHVRRIDPGEVLAAHQKADVGVVLPGDEAFPPALAPDHDAPSILFHLGDPTSVEEHAASIVGTRRSTGYGEASMARRTRVRCRRPARHRWRWSRAGSMSSTRAGTASSGGQWPDTASSGPRPRSALHLNAGGSRSATGSSPRWAACWSWSRADVPAGRCTRCARPTIGVAP